MSGIIDLTHTIEEGMPVFPGAEQPRLLQAFTLEADGFREKKLTFHSHTGTHMDAPAHVLDDPRTLDRFPVDRFVGSAISIRTPRGENAVIEVGDLYRREAEIAQCDYLLLNTGWERFWGDERYFGGFPVLSVEAARWLGDLGLKGVGVDAISVDPVASAELPVHRELLSRGMVIVENLANLDALPEGSFLFCCLPLKIKGADGAPVRAVAIEGRDALRV